MWQPLNLVNLEGLDVVERKSTEYGPFPPRLGATGSLPLLLPLPDQGTPPNMVAPSRRIYGEPHRL